MGWLFGKKKEPKIALPQGHPADEKELRFPSTPSKGQKVIEPDHMKKAAGMSRPVSKPAPRLPEMPTPAPLPVKQDAKPVSRPMPSPFSNQKMAPPRFPTETSMEGPLYVKVDVYQRLLGEIEDLKKDVRSLSHINNKLHVSEYNEDASFTKLQKVMKVMHDKLREMDERLFAEGN